MAPVYSDHGYGGGTFVFREGLDPVVLRKQIRPIADPSPEKESCQTRPSAGPFTMKFLESSEFQRSRENGRGAPFPVNRELVTVKFVGASFRVRKSRCGVWGYAPAIRRDDSFSTEVTPRGVSACRNSEWIVPKSCSTRLRAESPWQSESRCVLRAQSEHQ